MLRILRIYSFVFVGLLLSACTPKFPTPGQVADLQVLPQATGYYLFGLGSEERLISPDRQREMAEVFLARHFAPWDDWNGGDPDGQDFFWGLRRHQGRLIFGENLLPLPESWLEEMARRSTPESYPSLVHPAVTVLPTSLRVLPSHQPVFNNPTDPGQGFPFDLLQNSLVPAGTPVRVIHASTDRDWYLVMAPHFSGWVRPWEVAWVDQKFMEVFRRAELIAVTRDDAVVHTLQGGYALGGRVGMLLPRSTLPSPVGTLAVLAPQRRADGWAELKEALLSDGQAEPWPLPPTSERYARVLDGLLGQPYGWGGMFENRDCSALVQDVQGLFGIALPRNSRAQAQAGSVVDLQGLNATGKERHILEQGVPLLTLLNMPGHVMLYLGPDPISGRPVVLHSIWGLRIQDAPRGASPTGTPGRWVLGRTVITTLTPGAELPMLLRPQGLLVERVTGMTILINH